MGAGAGTLGNVTFVGILGTFVSFSGACEGNSQGLDFSGSLGYKTEGPLPPSLGAQSVLVIERICSF